MDELVLIESNQRLSLKLHLLNSASDLLTNLPSDWPFILLL
jgi:hypothetical protein